MFEAQVAFYLNKYLGQYVSGLDAESLKISVWKGDVELRNLLLKPEALAGLNLPITVKAGLLGKLTLKVPWNKLGQAPVVAEFDRLYILAAPREDDATSAPPESDDDAHVLAVEQDAKRKRVLGAENDWVKAHPETGKVYPNYLLFHPRDHAQAAMSEGPLTAKLTKYWMLDYPLTGCKETGKALEPYSCDKTGSNPGYTASAGVAALAAAERVNSTSVLLKLPKSSLDFGVKGCNEKGRCAYVVKSSHSYSDTNSGLQLTTRQQIGLDAAFARAAINPRVITGWAAGSEPMKKCSRAALHFIEEMGALQHWLPQAYKAANAGGAA
ncbi:hypothetical protein Rsub_12473 [Raphidocelis subcapitata]|uniref:Chorein N-terminal domain-containing protein n=1 Tax=Raphidocelis subcapitata TaxID=307507 RepID=A0A2V0PIL5_9CHLO|nr:hypothetical protein Rsub_12473 [Raphidocelis subcapitata]|eukprot:GBF99654.1 hypothetical protein Rsub_12473 [Raphidocelis subcapitata]